MTQWICAFVQYLMTVHVAVDAVALATRMAAHWALADALAPGSSHLGAELGAIEHRPYRHAQNGSIIADAKCWRPRADLCVLAVVDLEMIRRVMRRVRGDQIDTGAQVIAALGKRGTRQATKTEDVFNAAVREPDAASRGREAKVAMSYTIGGQTGRRRARRDRQSSE